MQASRKAVGVWLLAIAVIILAMVTIGGLTRITGSGLSITEWNIVTGTLPPLNHTQWMEAFGKYRQTPQFRLINADFTLSDYKFIYE